MLLVSGRADANRATADGTPPLHLAAASGHAKGARAAEGFKQRSRSAPSMEGRVRELEAKEAEAVRRAEAAETSAEQNLYAR